MTKEADDVLIKEFISVVKYSLIESIYNRQNLFIRYVLKTILNVK